MVGVMLPLASGLTGLGKTVLLLVAGAFIVWALYVSMIYPKKHPGFPRDLNLFIVVTVVFFFAQMGAVYWVTSTQEVEHEATSGEHGGSAEEPGGGETPGGEPAGDPAAGKEIFIAQCATCHTLADAGATGAVGPNLDDARPSDALVVDRVTNGRGAMPSFADTLDEQQIADVAAYVSSVAGQG